MKCQGIVCLYWSVSFATSAQQDYAMIGNHHVVQPPNTPSWPIHYNSNINHYICRVSEEFNCRLRFILPVRAVWEG